MSSAPDPVVLGPGHPRPRQHPLKETGRRKGATLASQPGGSLPEILRPCFRVEIRPGCLGRTPIGRPEPIDTHDRDQAEEDNDPPAPPDTSALRGPCRPAPLRPGASRTTRLLRRRSPDPTVEFGPHRGSRRRPVGRVLGQHEAKEVVEIASQSGEELAGRNVPPPGPPPDEHLVEKDPHRVEVASGIDRLRIPSLFGGEVGRRIESRRRIGRGPWSGPGWGGESRHPEIGDLDPSPLIEQDVGRLDIPVDDAGIVSHLERGENRPHDLDRSRNRQPPAAQEGLDRGRCSRPRTHPLHDQVVDLTLPASIEQRHDVRMIEESEELRLSLEPIGGRPSPREIASQDLDRDLRLGAPIAGQIDGSHPSSTEDPLQAIGAEIPAHEGTLPRLGQARTLSVAFVLESHLTGAKGAKPRGVRLDRPETKGATTPGTGDGSRGRNIDFRNRHRRVRREAEWTGPDPDLEWERFASRGGPWKRPRKRGALSRISASKYRL